MGRKKPGEGRFAALASREARLVEELADVEKRKQDARNTVTGKTRARAYVRAWLRKLSEDELWQEVELRETCEMRVQVPDEVSIDQLLALLEAAIFCDEGLFACEDMTDEGDTGEAVLFTPGVQS